MSWRPTSLSALILPVRVMRPPFEQASAAPEAATTAAPPRDRFDPEIFNRRYHGK